MDITTEHVNQGNKMTKKRYTLREIFANVKGTSFVGLDTVSTVKLKGGKSNEHQGRVKKITIGSQVMVFSNQEQNGYENMVQRRLIEEGKDPTSFSLSPRKWGTRVPNLPIIEHEKDGEKKEYLEVIFLRAGTSHYLVDDKVVTKEQLKEMVTGLEDEKDDTEETPSTGQGGLNNKVIVRTYSADNLINVRIDGAEYQFA
jgi:hypothetical protein